MYAGNSSNEVIGQGKVSSIVEPNLMWGAVGLRILREGEREEDGVVAGTNWWEDLTANGIDGGGCKHNMPVDLRQ